ncbi:MAG: malto-oligosyltrehalose synthase [Nitrososphaerota archaeon]|nr:malto-oligosyltrehalose synthase [Nitrososphaerota archaeon]
MKTPTATYRIQLNQNFTFSHLKAIVPYLNKLGISHIYASPIFQAEAESLHGYNITDPAVINSELGGRAGFEDLIKEVQTYGLEWLQDIVPNHASYTTQNKRICDVLAKGANSTGARFFDIDWNHPSEKLSGKLLLPILAEPYKQCLKKRQIKLIHNHGFKIAYGSLEFPINTNTQHHLELSHSVQQELDKYNNNPRFLTELLSRQHYCLAHWRTAFKSINYRRFFDINSLIGICMENPAAFTEWHRLIFELIQSGKISGLRVDHIDGLYEPKSYLKKLRTRCPDAYIVVEKILTDKEQLPKTWPIKGTTGYDFLNYVNKLLVQTDHEPAFNTLYQNSTGNIQNFDALLYEAKKVFVETYFLGDAQNLSRLFDDALCESACCKPLDQETLAAVVALMACFPLYRTYLDESNDGDDSEFRAALELAEQQNPLLANKFSAIARLLKERQTSSGAFFALKRFQQFTGAVMAKGLEDTVLYRYVRLLSLNEVGSSPAQFGVSTGQFHEFNQLRQQNWPLTLNATSTHDVKRGEDVRARLNVLSEIPDEFQANVKQWKKISASKKIQINNTIAPDDSETYYLYQTLLGTYPWDDMEKEFPDRIAQHMVKALREAKVHSCWLDPNLPYEEAVVTFVASILSDAEFMDTFLSFQRKIASYGFFNSLSQTLLKAACPGIPDFYWGSELWDLTLVDPDNRRPVNFTLRQKLLTKVAELNPKRADALLDAPQDGKAKLYTIYKTLQFRKSQQLLFEQGQYLPLTVKGAQAKNVVAFCRRNGGAYALVVVPRFPANLLYIRADEPKKSNTKRPVTWGDANWADTSIHLPQAAPTRWTEIFTEKTLSSSSGHLPIRDILNNFPVALLYGDEHG